MQEAAKQVQRVHDNHDNSLRQITDNEEGTGGTPNEEGTGGTPIEGEENSEVDNSAPRDREDLQGSSEENEEDQEEEEDDEDATTSEDDEEPDLGHTSDERDIIDTCNLSDEEDFE